MARVGRPWRASVIPPPPAPQGHATGNRGTRPRAPVNDRPDGVLLTEVSLPPQGGDMFCGIDWASERHAVCVLDDAGTTISTFQITHSADGLEQLVSRLGRLGDPAGLPVAIERPDGRLVDRLLEAGHPVVPVQSNAIKAWRDAEVLSGAKSDPGDAAVIAEYLRLRQHRLRVLQPFSPETRALRAVVRTRGDLVDQRVAAAGLAGTPEVEARRDAVLAMVGVLRALNQAIKQLDRSVIAHLGEHPDAEIFTSLPRSGRISAAQVLAEWGDCRPAYDGPDAVAALAGIVPVTKTSGKHRTVSFRWACNKRFRQAICTLADNSRHASPWAAKVYADAIARGCDHPHAIRVLARAWVRVIWRCWVDQVPYDPAKHGAARKLTETAASAA